MCLGSGRVCSEKPVLILQCFSYGTTSHRVLNKKFESQFHIAESQDHKTGMVDFWSKTFLICLHNQRISLLLRQIHHR